MANPLRLLRKAAEPAAPAAAALREHLRQHDEIYARIVSETARAAPWRLANERVAALKAQLADMVEDRDLRGSIAPLGPVQKQLLAAEHERDQLKASDNLQQLQAQRAQHAEKTPLLMRAAAIEQLESLGAEFLQKEAELREVQMRAFAAAGLADVISLERGLGVFFGYGSFGATHISRPLDPQNQTLEHAAFRRYSPHPEQAQREHEAEGKALDREIDALRQRLLATRG
jgi:hypothetical protein